MNKKNCLRILTVFVCLMLVCLCALAEECTHPADKQECVDWWAEGECSWTNNNDGTHTAVYTGVMEVYQCTDCGRMFPPVELEGEKRLIENHYFYLGGECDCGLTDDGSCAHENAVQEKEVRPGAVYTYVDEQKHSVSYTAVYVYNCPDCGCGFDVQGEYKTIEEEHMRKGENECAYCGVFPEGCAHENHGENFYHYSGEFTDNGDGTHTGMCIEMYGFWCEDCESYIAEVTDPVETERTFEHNWNDENVCDADGCGAVKPYCPHENHGENFYHYSGEFTDNGDGTHTGMCIEMYGFWCDDCDEYIAEVTDPEEKVRTFEHNWVDRTGPCDDCGAVCAHEDRTGYFTYYSGDAFKDNGDGTHTGMAVERYGFHCNDCDRNISEPTHEGEREYTLEHEWTDEGTCDADGCEAVWTCDHEDATFNETGKQFNTTYENAWDGNHYRSFDVFRSYTCNDPECGETFLRYIERGSHKEPHVFENGECRFCGANDCAHEDKTPVMENISMPLDEVRPNDWGKHTGFTYNYNTYTCNTCGETVYEQLTDEALVEEDCVDEDGDGNCDVCWWSFCEHEDKFVDEEGFHRCIQRGEWKSNGDGTHTATCEVGTRWYCNDCEEYVFEKLVDAQEYTYRCDGENDGYCGACGAKYTPCAHESFVVDNPNHVQPAEGEEWVELGFGQHGAICNFGVWGYCSDCDQWVAILEPNHVEYAIQQCWEGDTPDNRCDGCGEEYGENWGDCNHQGYWYNHYEANDAGWTDNGNGTHSGRAIEWHGFHCDNCQTHIAEPTHGEYREYTLPHDYNEETGKCWYCGVDMVNCEHRHTELIDTIEKNTYVVNNDDGTHMFVTRLLNVHLCQDCGETVAWEGDEVVSDPEDHTYENGACKFCGYPECDHTDMEKLTLEEAGMIRLLWGTGWRHTGWGTHTGEGTKYDRYTCKECGWAVLIPVNGTGETETFELDCFSNDDNEWCDDCGWDFSCQHTRETLEVRDDEHYEPIDGERWEYVGHGQHAAICDRGVWYRCNDCDQEFFADISATGIWHAYWCWDDDGDDRCDACGADASCEHNEEGVRWEAYYEGNGNHWTDIGDGLHSITGYKLWGFYCPDCGEFIGERTHDDERTYTFEHFYDGENGTCGACGAANPGCEHENAQRAEGGKQYNTVYENLFDGTHARYFDVYHYYTCDDCGTTFLRHADEGCEVDPHHYNAEGLCQCGAVECAHEHKTLDDAGIVRPEPGYRFFGEGMGYHWTEQGAKYNVYDCADCGQKVFEIIGSVEKNIRETCFDKNGDRRCDVCDWPAECTHPNRELRDECHWWMPDAEAHYVGGGMHEIMAHFGQEYKCPDCGFNLFDAYEDFRPYAFRCEDRDGDGRCDECHAEYCDHDDGGQPWDHELMTGHWTDNGDGTHSAEGYIGWGFNCVKCGEFIGHREHDDPITFTFDHGYSSEDPVCHCGAVWTCDHEDAEDIGNEQIFNLSAENLYDGQHSYKYDVYHAFTCNDCGETFMRWVDDAEGVEAHRFEDGACVICRAAECDHEQKTLRGENEFHLDEQYGWRGDGFGHHTGFGAYYDRYNCDTCRETVLVPLTQKQAYTFDCVEGEDEDGRCEECGYSLTCTHENAEIINRNHHEPVPGTDWVSVGNGKHTALCRLGVLSFCEECDNYIYDFADQEPEQWTEGCWYDDEDGDGHCDGCGAELRDCEHDDLELINAWHYEPVEGNWQFAGDGRHTAICDYGPIYWCEACERYVFRPVQFGVEGNWPCNDEDEDGHCDGCDAAFTPCTHPYPEKIDIWNTEYYELAEGAQWEYAGMGNHKALVDLYIEYWCNHCDTQYYVLYKSGVERLEECGHDWDEDGKCDDCGADFCRHEHASEDWTLEYRGDYTDNGDGTCTTTNGFEYSGVYCYDCEQLIGTITHDKPRTYTFEHDFVDGVCSRCEAQAGDCTHENAVATDEVEHINLWIGDYQDGNHIIWYDTLTTYNCPDCGEAIKRMSDAEDRTYRFEAHTFEDGQCTKCEAVECAHANKTEQGETFVLNQMESWTATGNGTHKGLGIMYTLYTCPDCESLIREAQGEAYYKEVECVDLDLDGKCDEWDCSWSFECEHPENRVVMINEHCERAAFVDNGDGKTHAATYYGLVKRYLCLDCREEWDETTEELSVPNESHGFVGGVCDCGAEDTFCEHENRKYEHDGKRNEACVYLNAEEHVHTYMSLDVYSCQDCGCWFDVDAGYTEVVEAHEFDENGECRYCELAEICEHEDAIADENLITDVYYDIDPDAHYQMNMTGCHIVHAVKCSVYDCPDCEVNVFVPLDGEGEGHDYFFECFDEDDDLVCDKCGWEFPDCDHENRHENRMHYVGDFTDNGDGTHSGYGMELEGFWCPDCEEFLAKPTHELPEYYENIPHNWNDEGECEDCTATCAHEHMNAEENFHMTVGDTEWEPVEGRPGWHTAVCEVGTMYECETCEYRRFEKEIDAQTYTYHCHDDDGDGVCEACGADYVPCEHPDREVMNPEHYEPVEGATWEPVEDRPGWHIADCDVGSWCYCPDCEEWYFEKDEYYGEKMQHCWDDGGDGKCDGCGADYVPCEHPNAVKDHDRHWPVEGTEWVPVEGRPGFHTADCDFGAFYDCPDCGEFFFKADEHYGQYTEHCWADEEDDEDADGKCNGCGADYVPCEHPDKRLINANHYEPIEGTNWEFAGNGRHTATCDFGPIYFCENCDEYIFEPTQFNVPGNWPCRDEEDGDGKCDDCGADYVPCEHPNKELDYYDHWEAVEGEEWVYVGNGHHKAICNAGPNYYCPDCEEHVFEPVEFNVLRYQECWDEDGDGECDRCGEPDTCNHENADRYDWTKEYVCDEWTDNGDGTHSGTGYEKEGFHCPDCGEYIASNTHENLVKFTLPHEFGEDGKCEQCGAEQADCAHENLTATGETEPVNPWIGDRNDGQHIVWYNDLVTYTCDDCGETVKRIDDERKWMLEDHTFEGGECACGAKDCQHENKTLKSENKFLESAGDWWKPDYHGKHYTKGAWYDIYACNDCGHEVHVLKRAEELVQEACYDEDEDDHCDFCGWEFCEHPHKRPTGNSTDTLNSCTPIDDYKHLDDYIIHDEMYCPDCEKKFIDDIPGTAEQPHEYENGVCTACEHVCSHADVTDEICDACGTDLSCKHPEESLTLVEANTYKLSENSEWTPTGEGTHTAIATLGNLYQCECGEYIFEALGEAQEYTFDCAEDEDADGLCDVCGGENDYTTPWIVENTITPESGLVGCEVSYYAEVTDNVELAGYQLYINDELVAEGTLSGKADVVRYTTTDLNVGEYKFVLILTDAQGNSSRTVAPLDVIITCEHTEFGDDNICDICGYAKVAIITQPQDAWAYDGEAATVTVVAVGEGLSYQWYYRNAGKTDWSTSSCTDATISVTMSEARDGRELYCVVTDVHGNKAQTNTVTLTLREKLEITTQPKNAYAYDGETAKVTVKASGTGLTYQWYVKNVGESEFVETTQTGTTFTVTMTAENDGIQVYCKVTDQYGNALDSNVVTLDTRFKPVITKHPESVTASADKEITFGVEATGEGLTYQWYYRNAGKTSWTRSSCTDKVYTTTMTAERDGRQVYCKVTDVYGNTVSSDTATMSLPGVTITRQPVDASAFEGETLVIGVEAEGDGLTYQWYYKNEGATSYKKSSSTNAIYAIEASENTDGRKMYCVVTDKYGRSVKSDVVTLDTRFVLKITEHPRSVIASPGKTVTFTVVAMGEDLTYEWFYKDASKTEWTKSSNTKATYSTEMKESRNGRQVYCVVTDANDDKVTSEAAVMLLPVVEITKQPVSASAHNGEKVKISVTATGDDLSYAWFFKNVGDTEFTQSTTKTATYTLTMNAERAGRQVYCRVTDGYGNFEDSDVVTLGVLPEPVFTQQPQDVTADVGTTVTFTVEVEGDGLTYQWYYRNAGTTTWKVAASTEATYSTELKAERNGRQVYCEVTDATGYSVSSNTATMKVTPAQITEQPQDVTAAEGETVTFTVKATGAGLKYQWYYRNAGTTAWKTASSTTASYSSTLKAERDGREVYCKVTDTYGNVVESDTAKMILKTPDEPDEPDTPATPLAITSQPSDVKAADGASATVSVVATGDGLTYQWYYRNAGTTAWKAASSTSSTYTFTVTAARDGREIYCKITDKYGNTVDSDTVKIIVTADEPDEPQTPLAITSHPSDVTAAEGESVTFTVKATGDGLTYQWYYRNAGASSWTKGGSTSASYTTSITAARDGREVYCKVTDKYGNTVDSNRAKMTLKSSSEPQTPLVITSHPSNVTAAEGESVTFTVKATGDGLTYQWYYRNAGASSWTKGGSTSASYTTSITAARDGREVYCKVKDKYGNTADSNRAKMTLKASSKAAASFEITSQPSSVKASAGESATVKVKATGEGLKYQWYYRNEGSSSWKKASSTSRSYTFEVTEARDGRQIYCKITNADGDTLKTKTVKVTVK